VSFLSGAGPIINDSLALFSTPIQKAGIFLDICTLSVFVGMIVTLPQCSSLSLSCIPWNELKADLGLPLPMIMQQSATNYLMKDKILLQAPDVCESMGAVTDLCIDMTGTITEDSMTVTYGLVGIGTTFSLGREGELAGYLVDVLTSELKHPDDATLNAFLGLPLQHLLANIFALTSGAIQGLDPVTGQTVFLGSTRETALLQFSKQLGWPDVQSVRTAAQDLEVIPFSNESMASGASVTLEDGRRRLYLKGASEVLLKKCTRYVVPDANKMKTRHLDSLAKTIIHDQLDSYAERGLRTLILCYRDFDFWPMKGVSPEVSLSECLLLRE
jgi:P-type Ca2+ transporter type 2C